jgi:hypothetical protein
VSATGLGPLLKKEGHNLCLPVIGRFSCPGAGLYPTGPFPRNPSARVRDNLREAPVPITAVWRLAQCFSEGLQVSWEGEASVAMETIASDANRVPNSMGCCHALIFW